MRNARTLPATAALLAIAAALAVAIAACGGSASPAPAASAAPTASTSPGAEPTLPAPTTVPGGETTPSATPGTFEIPWGTAWDALPAGFPLPPGAQPLDPGDPNEGPVSGVFGVGQAPDAVVATMQTRLTAAGYSTEALTGPYEDGSMVIDSVGRIPECRIQTRVRGLSGTTMITVLFGAACPWE